MPLQELNSGLIYTNSHCIGCNKCISGCVVVGANVVIKDESSNSYTVKVNPNKCILCGHCIEECVHDARTYKDDTDEFFEALEQGEDITVLVAPSLLAGYEKQYNNILGYLKSLGVRHIYNVSFGADIMVWVCMNFIKKFGLKGVISQTCPVIVNYLEKYKPELIKYLMPVQSPMMCTAIYVSDYLKNKDRLAYISPCIAQKYEMDDLNTYGKVSYHVTFQRLMKRMEDMDISSYYAEDESEYGLGALISMAGGLTSNIQLYSGFNEVLIQTTGPRNIFPYFDHYCKEVIEHGELPFLVDALNCTNGCNFGTATNCGVELCNEMTFSAHRAKEKAYRSGLVPSAFNYEVRLEILNERFKKFELSSFVRQYDLTRGVEISVLSEDMIEEIFRSMYKVTSEYRHTDCGACGYKTCHDMAFAIGTNVNHKENCINYSKECIRRETEKTHLLLSEISSMNEELKESAQLKSNFLANMSHEIRTPMNAVIGMAEMALRGDLPNEERGYIQQIKASGRSLLAIINDILDFSKIESGKMEINEAEYTVMSIMNDTINIVMSRIGEKDITLVVNADPEIPFSLYGDDIRIKQVLVNFANNAVKFTQAGCVELSMHHERSKNGVNLYVSVSDSGIGIKSEDISKLFSSFQQVDSTRNRNIEGTGLGLAISREFVRLMGGEIQVESMYGKGSRFSFRIPQKIIHDTPSVVLKEKETIYTASMIENQYVLYGFQKSISKLNVHNTECASLEEIQTAQKEGAKFIFIDYPFWKEDLKSFLQKHEEIQTVVIVDPRKDIITESFVQKLNQPIYCLSIASVFNHDKENDFETHEPTKKFKFEAPEAKVLIVDDNAINLTVAKGLLSTFHMDISLASGAMEAISMIEKNHYDLVFMDHMMPDVDGIEATRILRNKEGDFYKTLPIIALTANAINNAKDMFLQAGMNDFVAKPIDMIDITSKLKKWLPPEKIKTLNKVEDKSPNAKEKVLVMEGLDVNAGLALSGNMELYKKILGDYHGAIEKKASLINQYESSNNIGAYTIEVHALKSTSKLIGAIPLSEMAAYLEKCGIEKNLSEIKAKTAELLRCYRSYIKILAPYGKSQSTSVKEKITREQLDEKLASLYEALDNFDMDSAVHLAEELKSCQFDPKESEKLDQLWEAIEAMEYEDAQQVVNEWRNL